MTRAKISVVIPTKNRSTLAGDAIRSVLNQIDVDIEVIVVDDGGSNRLSADIATLDQRLRIVRHDRSLGVAAARNRGIREATAPWVAFLDDDDVWAPEKLARQMAALAASGASWSISGALVIDEAAEIVVANPTARDSVALKAELCSRNAVPGGGSSVVVSRAALHSVGLFDESLSMVADWEMWHRLAHRYECAIVAEPLVGYAVHAASMTSHFKDHDGEMARMQSVTKHYCDVPASVRLCSYLNWIATSDAEQHRLRGAMLRARVASRQRSISGMMSAVRLLVLPPRSRGWRVVTRLRGNKQIEVPVWLRSTA